MANRPVYEVQAQEWTTTSLLSKGGDNYYRSEIFGRDTRHQYFPQGPRDRKLKHYRPTATKPWVLVAFLCGVAVCIAFLEYAAEVQHRPPGSSSIARRAYLYHGSGLDDPDEGFHDYPRRQTTGAAATTDAAATTGGLYFAPFEPAELTLVASTSAAISTAASSEVAASPTAELTLTAASTTESPPSPLTSDEVTLVANPTTISTAASEGSPSSSEATPNAPSTNFSPAKPKSTAVSGGSPPSSETTPNAPSANSSPAKTTALAPMSSSDMASSTTPTLTVVPGMAPLSDVTGASTPTKAATIAAAPGTTTPDGSKLGLTENFTGADYFLAMYLPTFLTVLLRSGWAMIFAAMKMMEPFYRLARRGGASAQESLLSDYLSGGLSLDTLRAMWRGNRVLLLAGLVHLGTALVVTLAGESMRVRPTGYCHTHVSTHQPCNPVWAINRPVVRVMEALLCAIFVLVVALLFHTRKRFSGVFTDPSRISSMADLLGHPAFVEDLRNIPPFATADEVKAALTRNRYMLAGFEVPGGRLRYGVVKTEEGPPSSSSSLLPSQTPAGYTAFPNSEYQHYYSPPRKSWQASVARLLDVAFFLAVVLALFSIILAYWFLSGDDPLNNFFNSDTFGPRFLLTGGAVVASSGWKRFEREARIMEPYRRMADKRQLARAEDSVYASPTGTPFSTVFVALARRSYAVAVIAAVALLSQVLIIAVPGVPFSEGQIVPAYRASTFVSLAILGVMVLAFGVVVARRRGDPPMPRAPDTPVHVWLYLCASRMVDTSHGLEVVGRRVYPYRDCGDEAGVCYSYWCALSTGVDNRWRWMVDENRHHIYYTNYKDR